MSMHSVSLSRILISGILLLTWITTANSQATDTKPKPTGSISGRVTVGGKAAAGIPVVAYGGENLNRRQPAAKSKTDSEGRYRLTGLTSGQYQVAVLSPELTNSEAPSNYGFVFNSSSKSVFLAAAEAVEDIDLKLVRGGVITGRVTDADNQPVVEQRVILELLAEAGRMSKGMPYSAQLSLTDDRGVYRIYGLSAGRYRVSVGSNPGEGSLGSSRGFFQKTYHPDVTDPSRSPIVDLTEGGEAANIDIRLGRREEVFTVSGRVVDGETGIPLATGVRVSFAGPRKDREGSTPLLGGVSLADGIFKVPGFSPGRYGVYVSGDEGGQFYSEPVFFEVVDKDVSNIEIRAVRGLTISGVIENESGALKDLLATLPGLRVSAHVFPSGGRVDESTFRSGGSATVAPDGSFQIEGLRPGRVSISVYVSGGSKRPTIVRIESGGLGVTQGFDIQPGQSVSGLRMVLAYGSGVIRGSVKFEGGTAPDGARVFIDCKREGARMPSGGGQVDARGHFTIQGLSPGTYEVTLHVQVPMITPAGPRPRPPQKQFVNVVNDAEAEVSFVVNLAPKEGGP